MGKLVYGAHGMEIDLEDRLLAHLKVVIVAKLHRNEAFVFSWELGPQSGSGHNSIWLNPAIPLQFTFHGSTAPQLNRAWVEDLMLSANSSNGMVLLPEPEQRL